MRLTLFILLFSSFNCFSQDSSAVNQKHFLSLNFGFNASITDHYTIKNGSQEKKDNILFYNGSIKYDWALHHNIILDFSYTFDPIRVFTAGSFVRMDSSVYINDNEATSVYLYRGYFLQDYMFAHHALDINIQLFSRKKGNQKGLSFTTGVGIGFVHPFNDKYPIYPGAMDPSIDLNNDFEYLTHSFSSLLYLRMNLGLQYILPLKEKWSMLFAAHLTIPFVFTRNQKVIIDFPKRDNSRDLKNYNDYKYLVGQAIYRENGLIGKIGIRYALD